MTTAIAAFLKVYSDDTTHGKWQNFFVGSSVNGHSFVSFSISDIAMNRTADEGGVTLAMAATGDHLGFFESAITGEYLAEATIYEMPVSSELPTDLSSATVVARFIGEIMGMQTDLTTISVEIGAAMDAISGDIPGRKITTSLVGRLPTL